jgi:CheY-like chemotaxis protein
MLQSEKRALLVGPNADIEKSCQDVLEGCGFLIDAVASGIEAVVCARKHQPDIILIESQLPDVPCREAIDWLRCNERLRLTPVLVLNGSSAAKASFAEVGPVIVIPKPFSPQRVKRAIEKAFTPTPVNGQIADAPI